MQCQPQFAAVSSVDFAHNTHSIIQNTGMFALEGLRELIATTPTLWLAWGGLALGMLFGWAVQVSNFCVMGAISDAMSFGDYRRLRAWLLATAVAIGGAQTLAYAGVVDLQMSMYLGGRLNWFGHLSGGVIFGIGMVYAGGCTSRNLVRLGGGDLRALVVLMVVGISAYVTISGVLAVPRVWLEEHTAIALSAGSQSLAVLLAQAASLPRPVATAAVTSGLVAALLLMCFYDADFRRSPWTVFGGLAIGLCVAGGWALTGLAHDEFAAQILNPVSISFVRPSGDTLDYLQRYTAAKIPGFGVTTVFGVIAGALIGNLFAGKFKWTGFADSADTVRNLAGGALMGIGGVTALGCTIGQGVSGVSTLALGSLMTLVAITIGGMLGMRLLERSQAA
jgi:uncharacterized protein